MKICLHKYKDIEGKDSKICIKCGNLELPFWMRWVCFKMDLSSWLWKIRGLQYCPHHGYHSQNWFTGYCKQCKRNKWTKKEIQKAEREMESYY